jgi:hypothetical protein
MNKYTSPVKPRRPWRTLDQAVAIILRLGIQVVPTVRDVYLPTATSKTMCWALPGREVR